MNIGPVDYGSGTTPDGYRCGACGARDCKLWRGANGTPGGLWCCDCAAQSQGKDVSGIRDDGTFQWNDIAIDVIGWRVPAVPTEEGDNFWAYVSVPEVALRWWRQLPTRSPAAPDCPDGGDSESWIRYVFDVGPIAASAPHVAFDIEVGEEP